MQNCTRPELVITGIGVVAAIGQGKRDFSAALLEGRHAFAVMQRPGRQRDSAFIGAEIAELKCPPPLPARLWRGASLSAQAALVALHEAWQDARLDALAPERIGLVIGGSNVQQREQVLLRETYADRVAYLRPSYGVTFMDTDLCGLCTEQFPIRGFAHTVGGASASGQVAIIQAAQAVQAGVVDACIAIGALMDISYWECHGLRSLGAMGSDRFAREPAQACRPFDSARDGFIYGESCGAIVIRRADDAANESAAIYAQLAGWGTAIDGNRNPDPAQAGEIRAIHEALDMARLDAAAIDYINPHGTGSPLGDTTELRALAECGLAHAFINATKSVLGHGLSAAGAVEVIATLLQMQAGELHPSRNLCEPIDPAFNWVRARMPHRIDNAITLSPMTVRR
jgi:malonyl-ACP decarboxylase